MVLGIGFMINVKPNKKSGAIINSFILKERTTIKGNRFTVKNGEENKSYEIISVNPIGRTATVLIPLE